MKLPILDGRRGPRSRGRPEYRGTYRVHPTHCNALAEDDEINKLFLWFLEAGGESGVVGDLGRALRFASLSNEQDERPGDFEVVEVTSRNAEPESGGTVIGYDLSADYNNSLLQYGLKADIRPESISDPIWREWESVCTSYSHELNDEGLFQTFQPANDCLSAMIKLHDAFPGFLEGGDLRSFEVTGLYLVS